jgi:hypothetical protein
MYYEQGQWTEAEQLDIQVIETRKRILGQKHPDTLTVVRSRQVNIIDCGSTAYHSIVPR